MKYKICVEDKARGKGLLGPISITLLSLCSEISFKKIEMQGVSLFEIF